MTKKLYFFFSVIIAVLFFVLVSHKITQYFIQIEKTNKGLKKEKVIVSKKTKAIKYKTSEIILPKDKRITIVIDPGSGGKEFGQVVDSILEKELCLKFSLNLAKKLRLKGINTYLTRSSDYYISKASRLSFAEEKNPDIYLSIHAGKSKFIEFSGLELWGYRNKDAKLNELEVLKLSSNKKIIIKKDKFIIEKENRISSYILSKLKELSYMSDYNPNVEAFRRAYFESIATKNIPSFMFFLGYLSNKEDRSLLSDDNYLNKIAKSIAEGIVKANEKDVL